MKNKLFIGLLLSLFVMQACVKDEDKVFDASAAERMNAAIAAYRTTLTSAVNGWVVEYFPEDDRSMGGYNFLWKFNDDGTVAIAGEVATTNYQAGEVAVSDYDVKAEEGPILTLNTYNEVFHLFVEPFGSSDVDGYAGDYEFIIREVTPTQIVMTGKKYGSTLLLKPYTGGDATTWQAYLGPFAVLDQKMTAPVYNVNVNDTSAWGFEQVTRNYRAFSFTYKKAENNKTVPYITTPTGIKTYEPLTVDGKTAQYFTFDESAGKLISVEEGSNFAIKLILPPPPVNEIVANMSTYGYLRTGSSSVQTLISTCETNVYNGGEELVYIIVGDSPFGASYPGRGFVFGSYSPSGGRVWNSQFLFNFTPTGENLAITYVGEGLNASYYVSYFAPLLSAIISKSPYSITASNPINPMEVSVINPAQITLTSVADPAFYFTVNDFGQ